jgi:hypothetical protein
MEDTGYTSTPQSPLLFKPDASNLTARPWDDFEAMDDWIELAAIPIKSDAAGFWYCMQQWTVDRHFNRNIWRIDMKQSAFLSHDGSNLSLGEPLADSTSRCVHGHGDEGADSDAETQADDAATDTPFMGPPPSGQRYVACRELQRKTPAPCGGGAHGTEPCHTAEEWTAQYESPVDGRQTAIFGMVIPNSARANDNPRCVVHTNGLVHPLWSQLPC